MPILLTPPVSFFENSLDPNQLASDSVDPNQLVLVSVGPNQLAFDEAI